MHYVNSGCAYALNVRVHHPDCGENMEISQRAELERRKKRKKEGCWEKKVLLSVPGSSAQYLKKTKGDYEESLESDQQTSMKPTERKGDQFFLVRV